MAESTRTSPSRVAVDQAPLERYADLIVGFGANVQAGQVVEVRADLGKEALARAVAASAYRHGARFVDVWYHDPFVRRARIDLADPDSLDFVPSWHRRRVLSLGEQRCARIALVGFAAPGLYDDLAPELVARERFPQIPEYLQVVNEKTTNWTAACCPTPEWAEVVHPELEAHDALTRLWEQVLHVCRVDEPDPTSAWRVRLETLATAARRLTERRFDALHFEGPGTDLTVGLLSTSTWLSGYAETVDGIEHAPNLPTEEVFTAPDPQRADGVVRSTRPLQLKSGVLVEELVVRFEGGRAVSVDAETGADALRTACSVDEGGSRLGEVALVDGEGRVGALDTVFYTTLLDENAASHIALGTAYLETVGEEDRERANRSAAHIDFMIGGPEVDVTGITRDRERVPVLRRGAWQI